MVKKVCRIDSSPACDGQTDGQTSILTRH